MKKFHFSKIYFNKEIVDDPVSKIRVVVKEIPSLEISEEEYSLRVSTRYENPNTIHRDYAIEHHTGEKHPFPHLQFKFHTEEIGQFRIRIDVKDSEEYKKSILGFIYKIKNVLGSLEQFREGITKEILVLDLVNKLDDEGRFLTQKIQEGINKYALEFDEENRLKSRLGKLGKNPLLLDFMGVNNIKLIEESYEKLKKK
tara:strand:+ start:758 stop:1354 length:597 start_codon:yes stop_codon:yes gene_type:complete